MSEGTDYEIISRFTETEDSTASAAGPGLSVTTKTYPTAQIIPPNILNVSVTSISVEPEETVASDVGTAVVLVNTDRHSSSSGSGGSYIEADPTELHYAYVYGFPDGTVRPQAAITRAEAAAILARAFPQTVTLDLDTQYFTDTDPSAWYYEQVQLLASMGILLGDGSGHFNPNQPITREEFTALASRFIELKDTGYAADFTDVGTSWAQDSIDKMTSSAVWKSTRKLAVSALSELW